MTEVSDYWKPQLEKTERQRDAARNALRKLVRKGDDGRYRTTQNGDADVTEVVQPVLG